MKNTLLLTLALVLALDTQAYTANKAVKHDWKLESVHYVECQHYTGVLYKFKDGYRVKYKTDSGKQYVPLWSKCKVNRVNWKATRDDKRGYKF